MFSLGARTWEPGTCLQRGFVSHWGILAVNSKKYFVPFCPPSKTQLLFPGGGDTSDTSPSGAPSSPMTRSYRVLW